MERKKVRKKQRRNKKMDWENENFIIRGGVVIFGNWKPKRGIFWRRLISKFLLHFYLYQQFNTSYVFPFANK
jgi:hypothetical protein